MAHFVLGSCHDLVMACFQIYRRSVNASYSADPGLSMEALKFEVTTAVEHEVSTNLQWLVGWFVKQICEVPQ